MPTACVPHEDWALRMHIAVLAVTLSLMQSYELPNHPGKWAGLIWFPLPIGVYQLTEDGQNIKK